MRKLALFALGFAASTLFSIYLLPIRFAIWAAIFSAAVIPAGFLFHPESKGRARWIIGFCGFASGLFYFILYTTVILSPVAKYSGSYARINGTVCSFPTEEHGKTTAEIRLSQKGMLPFTAKLSVEDVSLSTISPGDRVSAHVKLSSGIESGAISNGILLIAEGNEVQVTGRTIPSLKGLGAIASHTISQRISDLFPESLSPTAIALLTGDKTEFNRNSSLKEAFQRCGLSHIIAVSGMHMSYLLAIPGFLFRNKKRYAWLAIPLIIFFMFFAGLTPSVCRAGIMCLLICAAGFFKREPDTLTSLSLSLLILLVINPYSGASLSLQLSFASVFGILTVGKRLQESFELREQKKLGASQGPLSFLISALNVSLGALSTTVPLSALYFGRLSLAAPIVSVLVSFLVPAAFLLIILSIFLSFFWLSAGTFIAAAAGLFLKTILWLVKLFSSLFFASVYTDNIYIILWLIALYAALIILLAARAPGRSFILPVTLLAIALCCILLIPRLFSEKDFSVNVLDVGQGQCVIFRSGGRTILVDCGSSSGKDAGAIALSWMQGSGISSIDCIILTHYHADHVNGIKKLLQNLTVNSIIMPPFEDSTTIDDEIAALAGEKGCECYFIDQTITISIADTTLTIYPSFGSADENEACCSVLCSYGNFDTLITGDMPSYCEIQLMEFADFPVTEIFIVGHHGSSSSSCNELLDQLQPEIAIISVGENSYGHPTESTIQRLEERGIQIFRTDLSGTITISSQKEVS